MEIDYNWGLWREVWRPAHNAINVLFVNSIDYRSAERMQYMECHKHIEGDSIVEQITSSIELHCRMEPDKYHIYWVY